MVLALIIVKSTLGSKTRSGVLGRRVDERFWLVRERLTFGNEPGVRAVLHGLYDGLHSGIAW